MMSQECLCYIFLSQMPVYGDTKPAELGLSVQDWALLYQSYRFQRFSLLQSKMSSLGHCSKTA